MKIFIVGEKLINNIYLPVKGKIFNFYVFSIILLYSIVLNCRKIETFRKENRQNKLIFIPLLKLRTFMK